ncbi:PadR family transcriptional regulator [Paenibacillus sp. MER 180]|uniref:PadR family transcriptional regulator n=1 Tax=Paenibacillus sp. MER 180 TaxID=2939570 RepID=UPI002041BBFE|nr:PadR family transcriptional regulator [Paenibacillus sp. MER 180]MCM3292685.1 PadR family transcriptional regulator [Paenibacillus sp. MER 180]
MSLKFGILGFLSKWEATGYDLKKEFDDFMSIFWHSHLSQIYPELGRLEQEDYITSRMQPQTGKPDKKIYAITEKGKQELISWLLSPPETPKLKDSFLMQVFFMDNIPAEEVIFQLKAYQKEREQRLAKMKRILHERWESIRERNVMNSRILMSSAVIRRGLEQEIHYISWCKDTIELVESCSALWSQDIEKSDLPVEAYIRFSDVEPLFKKYYGNLTKD